jgi:broad specificity phosphatase PhoE
MGVVAELILIRHGQSASNVAFPKADAAGRLESGLTGRDTDVELTDLGREQAAAVGRWLAALPADRRPEVVITSPYLRARETWRLAANASGLRFPEPTTDDRLVDRLLGDLEMMTLAAIRRRFPDEEQRRAEAGDYRYRPPNGESFADIEVRLGSFLADLNRNCAGRRVVVVAHDAVVLMMRAVIEDLDWDAVVRVSAGNSVRNASITRFDGSSGRLVLDRYNSVDHLPAEAEPRDVPSAAPDQASPPDAAA